MAFGGSEPSGTQPVLAIPKRGGKRPVRQANGRLASWGGPDYGLITALVLKSGKIPVRFFQKNGIGSVNQLTTATSDYWRVGRIYPPI